MKKFLYFSAVISAVFAFSACQKEISVIEEPEELVTITFTADKVAETKTAANEGANSVSYIWTEGDENRIKLFIVGTETVIQNEVEVEKEVLTEVANATATIDYSTNKMSITASVAPNATYTFRAVFCDPDSYTGSGTNYDERKPKIKTEQYPDGTKSFDPSADILVTDDMEVAVGAASEGGETATTGSMLMTFHRKVVINKMTLKNLLAGELVEKVVITSLTNGGDIQGYLLNGEMAGQSKSITIKYPGGLEVAEGGQFPVYFVSMAASGIALKIDVTTDQNTYSKSFASGKSISLNLEQFTRFGFALPEGVPVTELANGDYFITNDTGTYAASAYANGNNNLNNPIVITVDEDNETITSTGDLSNSVFTFTRIMDSGDYNGKYTIQDANGLYLYSAGGESSNHLKGEITPDQDGNAYWNVTKNNDGTYSIESAGTATRNKMRYNDQSNIFSCYGSGQQPITLYPASWCNSLTSPFFTIEESERTKDVIFNAPSAEFNFAKNSYASGPVVEVTSDSDNIISGTPVVSNNTITVTLTPNTDNRAKTATLSVSSNALESPITLTINQGAYVDSELSDTFDLTIASYSSSSENSVIWDGTSATVTLSKNSSRTNANNYLGGDANNRTSSRFYTDHLLSITPKEGYIITYIEFTAASEGYATNLYNSNWTNAAQSVSSSKVTVTPTNGESPITAVMTGTCGLTQIVIHYLHEGGGDDGDVTTTTLTNTNIVNAGSAKNSYKSYSLTDNNNNQYSAYAIKNYHSNATSSYHYLQIKKYASNTAYYIHIPELGSKITSITMTVSSSSKPMNGGENTSTLFFSNSNSTSSTGTGVAFGTGASSVTINTSSLNLNSGYITSNGAVRIWDIEITYTN